MLLLAAIAAGCAADRVETARITLGGRELVVEVADSPAEQRRGLQGRPKPGDSGGMLFVWDDAAPRSFVLGDVDYDIDIVFVGADGVVNETRTIGPGGDQRVEGRYPSRWVVEVRGGWADRYGVGPGDTMSIE